MKCKLCNQEKVLIKKSHIFSEFLHKELFDENHKLRKFEVREMMKVAPKISKPSSGSYESNLLCNDCDNVILNRYENYVSRALMLNFKDVKNPKCIKSQRNGINFIDVKNIAYKETKLFLLSLLWRAHISSLEEYKDVSLGPYGERIRRQLINGDPSTDDDIRISIFKFQKGSGFDSFIGQPIKYSIELTTAYSIIINGHLIVFYLKENTYSKILKNERLKVDNSISLIELPKEKIENFVMHYVGVKNN